MLKLGGKPVLLDELVLPVARFPDLTRDVFARRPGTIYGLYQERYATNVVRISERLSATLPPARIARVLGVRSSAPVLLIDRTAYSYHDTPVELRTSWVDTARHEYLSDLWKNERP